jgi:hypothetical protein
LFKIDQQASEVPRHYVRREKETQPKENTRYPMSDLRRNRSEKFHFHIAQGVPFYCETGANPVGHWLIEQGQVAQRQTMLACCLCSVLACLDWLEGRDHIPQ